MRFRNRRNRCSSRRKNEGDRDCFRRDNRNDNDSDFDESIYDGDNYEEVGYDDDYSRENRSGRGNHRDDRDDCDDRDDRDDNDNCDKKDDRRRRRRRRNSDRSYIVGNSVDICVRESDTEVKAKIVVQERDTVRIWGQVVDCHNKGVAFALVKLLKEGCRGLESVSHSITDCNGFYQFEVCPEDLGREFTILASKDARSKERVASRGIRDNNCKDICRRNGSPGDCGGFC